MLSLPRDMKPGRYSVRVRMVLVHGDITHISVNNELPRQDDVTTKKVYSCNTSDLDGYYTSRLIYYHLDEIQNCRIGNFMIMIILRVSTNFTLAKESHHHH